MPVSKSLTRRMRSRALDERGMTMAMALGMLAASMAIVLSSFAAVKKDLPLARGDQDRKNAYAAAEAGINYYSYHLTQDNAYWTNCTNVPDPDGAGPDPNPVVQMWNGTGTDTRTNHWRKVPGSNAEYAIEVLPAPGYSSCVEDNQATMIDPATNTFRIRSTGRDGGTKRSIVASFKRQGFLDYLYFSDYETLDPLAYPTTSQQTAADNCQKYHFQGRSSSICTEIRFITGDLLEGPVHTNDDMLICGNPTFGSSGADNIEAHNWWDTSGCTGSPNFVGTWKPGSAILAMPVTNGSLASIAGRTFTGTTEIRFVNGNQMQVKNANQSPIKQTFNFPSNGLVYVNSGTCGTTYKRKQEYNDPAGCANVYVSGTYSQDLTIASAGDIIIRPENCSSCAATAAPTGTDGNVISSNNALLGLIPNNFVRIYHPVSSWANSDTTCTNATGTMQDVEVDAAILALTHSFIVDNWYCGADLGTITVKGAIAQKFRGTVGTGGGGSGSGYLKDYQYDTDLHYQDPPYFLQPDQSSWTIRRFVEQSPAR
jgi:hypothetical protein